MATGDLHRPPRRGRRRLDEAIRQAEARTGLQLAVVIGAPAGRDLREHAESVFVGAGLGDRPAVLVLVAPRQHHVEVVTGPRALARVSDLDAATAVEIMVEAFARGELVPGLVAAIEHLAAAAGPGAAPADQRDLPNILEADH